MTPFGVHPVRPSAVVIIASGRLNRPETSRSLLNLSTPRSRSRHRTGPGPRNAVFSAMSSWRDPASAAFSHPTGFP
jgi:hypothetical protein